MAGERRYTRIPPESTGDRILLAHSSVIPYTGKLADYNWAIGEEYVIKNSSGDIKIHLHDVVETSTSVGVLYIHYDNEDEYNNITAEVGVNIEDHGATVVGVVASGEYDIFVNTSNIVGATNPKFGVDIDKFGSMNTRFAEGAPEISSFGGLRTTEQVPLAEYDFSRDELVSQFANSQEGKGVKTWDSDIGAIKMTVSGDPVSLDRVTNTSNLFHPFIPGSGVLFIFAARASSEKAGVVRNWGAFDSTDGYFFQAFGDDGSGNHRVRLCHRYTLDGNPTANHFIEQADWNKDKLDGSKDKDTNPSGMNLNIETINLYWVDFQHNGGGRVRWGVYYNGERIVCHEAYHNNGEESHSTLHNPTGNPNRPLCWAIANRTAAGTPSGSSADFFAYGGAVYLEGDVDPFVDAPIRNYATNFVIPPNTGNQTQYAFTLSPQIFLPSAPTIENHSVYSPRRFNVSTYQQTDDTVNVRTEVRVFAKCVIRGTNFQNIDYTTVEVDKDADHLSHGPEIIRFVINGEGAYDFTDTFKGVQYGAVKNGSDQAFAKQSQALVSITGNADPENTGVKRVTIKVKQNPITGADKHFFNDKEVIGFRGSDGSNTMTSGTAGSIQTLQDTDFYLSFIDADESFLYNSEADLDDDRNARVLRLSANSATINVGDKLIFDYTGDNSANCSVLQVVDPTTIWVEGRSNADIDTTMGGAAGNNFTVFGTAVTGTTDLITKSGVLTHPLDYKTTLLAVDSSGWVDPNEVEASPTDFIYGSPPIQAAWTFMIRTLSDKASNTQSRFSITWQERTQ